MTYSYDAFGNRLQREAYDSGPRTTVTERFGYDGWDPAKPISVGNESFDAWVDLDDGNNLTVRRVYGSNFDEPLARQDGSGTVQWYGRDHLGSVRQVFDNSTGAAVSTVDFDASGVVLSGTRVDRYGFTGREWDDTLGLQYSRARMYNPATGRWLQEDPLGHGAGDSNLYRYVGNDPKNWIDPSGLAGVETAGVDGVGLASNPEITTGPYREQLGDAQLISGPYRHDPNDFSPLTTLTDMRYDQFGNPISGGSPPINRQDLLDRWLQDRNAEANGQMILRDKDGNIRAIGQAAHGPWQPIDLEPAFAVINAMLNQMMNPPPNGPSAQAMADGPGGVMQYGGDATQPPPRMNLQTGPDNNVDVGKHLAGPYYEYYNGESGIFDIYEGFLTGAYRSIDALFTLGGPPIPRFDKAILTGNLQYIWDPTLAKRELIFGAVNGAIADYDGYRDHGFNMAESYFFTVWTNAPIASTIVSIVEAGIGQSIHGSSFGQELTPKERAERLGGATVDSAAAIAFAYAGRGALGRPASVGPTLPNTTRGWRVGQPINNLTSAGKVPSWTAVRQRFWKNEAHFNPGKYNADDLARMQRGLAPQRINPRIGRLESMELHHTPPQRKGGLFDVRPVWPDDHALIDPFRHTGN